MWIFSVNLMLDEVRQAQLFLRKYEDVLILGQQLLQPLPLSRPQPIAAAPPDLLHGCHCWPQHSAIKEKWLHLCPQLKYRRYGDRMRLWIQLLMCLHCPWWLLRWALGLSGSDHMETPACFPSVHSFGCGYHQHPGFSHVKLEQCDGWARVNQWYTRYPL